MQHHFVMTEEEDPSDNTGETEQVVNKGETTLTASAGLQGSNQGGVRVSSFGLIELLLGAKPQKPK
jgi:hypothetical protein